MVQNQQNQKIVNCPDCQRAHTPEQPCPKRIANVYPIVWNPKAFYKLTLADKAWIMEHNTVNLVEEAITRRIEDESTP